MRVHLLRHNKIAYQKVCRALEESPRTCVVQPTGTGKSYLIAAVSEKYKRVLILGPNNFVLDQVKDVMKLRKDGVEFMTYTLLNMTEQPKTDYDLICLDEFHRAGAPEWGDAVQYLLSQNQQAKVFGTSATPIRDIDNGRDMTSELFDGNIAYIMSIAEAWNRAILPIPKYVTGLFDFRNIAKETKERINEARYLSQEEKRNRLTRLNNLRLDWEQSAGMPVILRKYLDPNTRRVIVFCANIERLQHMKRVVSGWFKKAGLQVGCVSTLYNGMTYRQQRKAMEDFESDEGEGIKLMFSVNMLNEGVHIPRVNAVLMLRTTSSRIIYLQQLGRCLTAANTEKPVVFDIVDNMTQTNIIHSYRDEYHKLQKQNSSDTSISQEFIIHDHCKSYRELLDGLIEDTSNNIISDDLLIKRVLRFIDDNGRLPLWNGAGEERKLYAVMIKRREVMMANERIKELFNLTLRQRGSDGVEINLSIIRQFIQEKGRLPKMGENPYFGKWKSILKHRDEYPEIASIHADYSYRKMTDFEVQEWAARIIAFINEKDRLPSTKNRDKDEIVLAEKFHLLKMNYSNRIVIKEMLEVTDQYRLMSCDEVAELVIQYEKEHGKMPGNEEKSLYCKFQRRREYLIKTNPTIAALCKKYYFNEDTPRIRFEKLKAYCEETGHLPSRGTASKEMMIIREYLRKHPTPEIVELFQKYDCVGITPENEIQRRICIIENWVKMNGHLPNTHKMDGEEREVALLWSNLKSKYKNRPEIKRLISDYPSARQTWRSNLSALSHYNVGQMNLRSKAKSKYGYYVVSDKGKDPNHRYNIYYTAETQRNERFEMTLKKAGFKIVPFKD